MSNYRSASVKSPIIISIIIKKKQKTSFFDPADVQWKFDVCVDLGVWLEWLCHQW